MCERTNKEAPGLIVTGCSADVKEHAIQSAEQCGVAFMDANSLLIMDLGFGEQIAAIADMFAQASRIQPVILYIDNLDLFLPRLPERDNYADVRVSSCLDHLDSPTGTAFPVGIFIMGVTDVLVNVDRHIVNLLQLAIAWLFILQFFYIAM
jgi:SpoVK/Ycf46/Vps4 family AAA+-type ATPase